MIMLSEIQVLLANEAALLSPLTRIDFELSRRQSSDVPQVKSDDYTRFQTPPRTVVAATVASLLGVSGSTDATI